MNQFVWSVDEEEFDDNTFLHILYKPPISSMPTLVSLSYLNIND